MIQKIISFCGIALQINYPAHATKCIDFTFRKFPNTSETNPCSTITVTYDEKDKSYSVIQDDNSAGTQLDPVELSLLLLTRVTYTFSHSIRETVAISGSALERHGSVVLIIEEHSPERILLTTWLLSMGYHAITNNLLVIDENDLSCFGLPLPYHVKKDQIGAIKDFLPFHDDRFFLQNKDELLFFPESFSTNERQQLSCFLFSDYRRNTTLQIKTISQGVTASRLMGSVANGNNLKIHGLTQVSLLSRKTPTLTLRYNRPDQLKNSLDPIINHVLDTNCDPDTFKTTIEAFQIFETDLPASSPEQHNDSQSFPLQPVTPIGRKRKLTIGMATYDDYDGVYFSVQALRMYHPEITADSEIIVIDNHPDGPCAESLKKLDESIDGFRYIPLQGIQSTSVRNFLFYHATGDYVLCIDCHVFMVPGAVKKLLDYYDAHPDTHDLLQGPMIYDNLQSMSTHFQPEWRGGMYGTWDYDKRADDPLSEPFDIPMQGLGLFSCRKDVWPGFNPRFRGFGGEEGYIHEKFRQAGGRALCLPFLRWLHRFGRPIGVPYPVLWEDRIHNYLVGFKELGINTQPIRDHFVDFLGEKVATTIFEETVDELESPFYFFDAIYCITLNTNTQRWRKIEKRFKFLGIEERVRIFEAVETPTNHHIGCALSHRSIIESAKMQKLDNVLVFEDDAIFLDSTMDYLKMSIEELRWQDWSIFYLGGHRWQGDFQLVEGCSHLKRPHGLTCTHALAYHSSVYDEILNELPDNEDEMTQWVQENRAIDQYLTTLRRLILSHPPVATQIELLPQEDKSYQDRFIID